MITFEIRADFGFSVVIVLEVLGPVQLVGSLVEIPMMNMYFDDFEKRFGRQLLIYFRFFKFHIFCFIRNLQRFVVLIVFDYLLKVKNSFLQILVVLLLTIQLTI